MDVSIIIVNYNTKALTRNCIASVFSKTKDIEFEVILVDNASTDGSIEYFQKDQRIIFVESGSNLGFGKANNLGYQYATGKYIFLLNSDTILLNNAIKCFFDYAEQMDERIACVGAILIGKNGEILPSYGRFPFLKGIFIQLSNQYTSILGWNISGFNYDIAKGFPKNVDYITGADLFIRKTVIDQLGLFDPAFFMYYEETEMQYRYQQSGYVSNVIEGPQIVHLHGIYKKKPTMRGMYISTEGCFTYCRIVMKRWAYCFVRVIYPLILFPKILLFPTSLKDKFQYLSLLMSRK